MGPTPVTGGIVNVGIISGGVAGGRVELYNISGRMVRRADFVCDPVGRASVKLDVASLASGLYFTRAVTAGGSLLGTSRKLVLLK